MLAAEIMKPSYDEWMYWTQVIVDRLTTITHVYAKPPQPDVFMPERERQSKLGEALEVLRHLQNLTDEHEFQMPRGLGDTSAHEEILISSILPTFRDVLDRLPSWSADMQFLLKSPWFDQCAGKLAEILFRGMKDDENQGIGSGLAENGRLPAVIEQLLDREAAGGTRAPREQKPRAAESRMRREELARLWGERNSGHMRSAGRMG